MLNCGCEEIHDPDCHCERTVVCIKDVSFRHGNQVVLDGVSLCLHEGVFLGIIGPNGGGKTTLLKLMVGALPLQSGSIEVFGKPVANIRNRSSLIGYVPQRNDIDQHFPATALDVVLMGAAAKAGLFRRVARPVRARACELLDRVGVGDLRDRPIGRMSGGQQQRTFIARALIGQPRLLVLDEPTAGLDSTGQQQFLHFIHELQRELGLSVVMVSHDIGQLGYYADQIACVNRHLHWHDRSTLLTEEIIHDVYACELDAYRERIREILAP